MRRERGRRQRFDARAEEQVAAEERIGRRVEIDRREDVGADDVGRETLAVLRIVGARGEGQPVADLEIERADDRPRRVLEAIGLVEPVARTEEGAGILATSEERRGGQEGWVK